MRWKRYSEYLIRSRDEKFRDQVMAWVEQEDSPMPVTFQLELLKAVGFSKVELLHKNSCFVAFGAVK
jgi:tRNA (cmo5U34)-methyltransferase